MATTVSIDKAAVLLHVSRRTIYNRIKEGKLQTIRTVGGSQRVITESIARAHLHDVGTDLFVLLRGHERAGARNS